MRGEGHVCGAGRLQEASEEDKGAEGARGGGLHPLELDLRHEHARGDREADHQVFAGRKVALGFLFLFFISYTMLN